MGRQVPIWFCSSSCGGFARKFDRCDPEQGLRLSCETVQWPVSTRRSNGGVEMSFLKSSVLLGLYLLLPVMLLWIGLTEIGGLLAAMATPIADLFPSGTFDQLKAPGIVALIIILIASLITGLAAKVPLLRFLGDKLENTTLKKIPMYRALKVMSSSLLDTGSAHVKPGLIKDGSGGGDPCYVMETYADGRAVVLLPWSPASFAGSTRIVQQSDIEILSCSLDEFSRAISQMGVGLGECMKTIPDSDG